jgi:phytoene dehydrogenase-like protein
MKGGMGAISESIANVGRKHGLQIRTGAPVASIITQHGKAIGVALEDGEEIHAKIVIANASARTTFTKLLPQSELTPEFKRGIDNLRSESSSFKMNLAVDRLTDFIGFDPAEAGFAYPTQVRIAPSMDYMVKAMEDTREHHFSPNPVLLFMTPSTIDPTLAPAGKHVVNIFGNHAPYTLRGTTWDEQRQPLLDTALQVIEGYAPGFADCILHVEMLAPLDLERRYDLPRGHIHHAEITSDQIFFKRPVPRYADYRSPIGNLYLCGASNHPGGGVTGVPGHNAAQVVLSDRKNWR